MAEIQRLTIRRPRFILIGMSRQPHSDEHLAAQVSRDQSAFAELHARYDARLRGFLRVKGHNDSDIADLSQESWLKAFNQLSRGKPFEGNFKSWLFRIAENAGTDLRRKRRPGALAEDVDPAIPEQKWQLDAEDSQRLQHCFGNLSDRERDVVKWRLEGRSNEEVAESLAIEAPQVYATFHRAKAKLQTCLGVEREPSCTP